MPKISTKIIYIGFIGLLTTSAAMATYWQTNKYFQSKTRWQIIRKQLSKKQPDQLSILSQAEIFPLKYVQIFGSMDDKAMLISRTKESRMGYLIVRAVQFKNNKGQKQYILAAEGWIPEQFQYTPKQFSGKIKGILRQKQKVDFLHTKMKAEDIQKFNMNTYIDIDKSIEILKIRNQSLRKEYYLEILRDLNDGGQDHYPYQYSVDNFQLPYLTPDKHRAYAMFWSLSTIVGLSAIIKAMRMK